MWSENRSNWSNRTKEICPFSLADKDKRFSAECVHENCAWYSTDERCLIETIVQSIMKNMDGDADNG